MRIKRKKNNGTLLIEPLKNGFDDLKDGDEYVYLGKYHKVLLWASIESDDDRIGKVIWDYNMKDRARVINKFNEDEYAELKKYIRIRGAGRSMYGLSLGKTISIATTYADFTSKRDKAKKELGLDVLNVVIIRNDLN